MINLNTIKLLIALLTVIIKVKSEDDESNVAFMRTIITLNCQETIDKCDRSLTFNNYINNIEFREFYPFGYILIDLEYFYDIIGIDVEYSIGFDKGTYTAAGNPQGYEDIFILTVPTTFIPEQPLPPSPNLFVYYKTESNKIKYMKVEPYEILLVRFIGLFNGLDFTVPLNFKAFYVHIQKCPPPGTSGYCDSEDRCLYQLDDIFHMLTCICNNPTTPDGDLKEIKCRDIDECQMDNYCNNLQNTICINTIGTFICQCNFGFHSISSNTLNCIDSNKISISLGKKTHGITSEEKHEPKNTVDGNLKTCYIAFSQTKNQYSPYWLGIELGNFFQIAEIRIYVGPDTLEKKMFNILNVFLVNEYSEDPYLKFNKYETCENLYQIGKDTLLSMCNRFNPPVQYVFLTKFKSINETFQICEVDILPHICFSDTNFKFCEEGDYCVEISNGTNNEKKCVCKRNKNKKPQYELCEANKEKLDYEMLSGSMTINLKDINQTFFLILLQLAQFVSSIFFR